MRGGEKPLYKAEQKILQSKSKLDMNGKKINPLVPPEKPLYKTEQKLSKILESKLDMNGNEINPLVPPKNITYKILYTEFLSEVPPITTDEKRELKAKFIKPMNYKNSIGANILLNGKLYALERVKWWYEWCKTLGLDRPLTREEEEEQKNIQRLYTILIPIRNGLLNYIRKFKNYKAEDIVNCLNRIVERVYNIDDIDYANEMTKQKLIQQAQHGGGVDYYDAKAALIEKIYKMKTKFGFNTIDLFSMAKESVNNMHNVKKHNVKNSKKRASNPKKPTKRARPTNIIINDLVGDKEVIWAWHDNTHRLNPYQLQEDFNRRYGKRLELVFAQTREVRDEKYKERRLPEERHAPEEREGADRGIYEEERLPSGPPGTKQEDLPYEHPRRHPYHWKPQMSAHDRFYNVYEKSAAYKKKDKSPTENAFFSSSAEQDAFFRDLAEKARQAKEEQMKREREAEDDEAGPAPQPAPQPAQRPSPQPAQKQKSPKSPKSPPGAATRAPQPAPAPAPAPAAAQKPKSPPGAATRAPAAAVQPPIVPTQDDLNLGSLEMWDAISKTTIAWDNYTGIRGIVGNNDNIVASVMLFLYLRDNYTPKFAIENLKKKHFGYSDKKFEDLITGLKKDVFNTTLATRSIGDEFFKLKDSHSTVNSILRTTLLRQRLNRVFFFLARYHKCIYFGYKQSSGTGYDFADEIGITREDFKKIMEKPNLKMATINDVEIPYDIKKIYLKWLLGNAPDKVEQREKTKANAANVVLDDIFYKMLDAKLLFADYITKQMNIMCEAFSEWYKKYQINPKILEDADDHFYPVKHDVDWGKYEAGEYIKEFYDLWFYK